MALKDLFIIREGPGYRPGGQFNMNMGPEDLEELANVLLAAESGQIDVSSLGIDSAVLASVAERAMEVYGRHHALTPPKVKNWRGREEPVDVATPAYPGGMKRRAQMWFKPKDIEVCEKIFNALEWGDIGAGGLKVDRERIVRLSDRFSAAHERVAGHQAQSVEKGEAGFFGQGIKKDPSPEEIEANQENPPGDDDVTA